MARGYRYSGGGGGLPSSSNLKAIQKILDNHQEQTYLSIGQEVDITVNGQPWTMIIAAIDLYSDHEIILVSKELFSQSIWDDTLTLDVSFYANIDVADRIYIKETTKQYKNANSTTVTSVKAYTWTPNAKEAADVDTNAVYTTSLIQFDLFRIQANRIKQYAGANSWWWTFDKGTSEVHCINDSGVATTAPSSRTYGLLPCFKMTPTSKKAINSLSALQEILDNNQISSLEIGQEVIVTLNNQPWTMQIAGINIYEQNEVILVSKHLYAESAFANSNTGSYSSSLLKGIMDGFYNLINEGKEYIQTWNKEFLIDDSSTAIFSGKVMPLCMDEIIAGSSRGLHSTIIPQQLPLFLDVNNRIKTYNSIVERYYTGEHCAYNSSNHVLYAISESGAALTGWNTGIIYNTVAGVLPSFKLKKSS